jgi:hypothetical protein
MSEGAVLVIRSVPVRSAGVQWPCPFPAGAGELGVLTVTPANPYSADAELPGGEYSGVARNQTAVLAHQRWRRPAPLLDARGYRGDVGIRVGPSIFRVWDQPIDRPALDLVGRPRPLISGNLSRAGARERGSVGAEEQLDAGLDRLPVGSAPTPDDPDSHVTDPEIHPTPPPTPPRQRRASNDSSMCKPETSAGKRASRAARPRAAVSPARIRRLEMSSRRTRQTSLASAAGENQSPQMSATQRGPRYHGEGPRSRCEIVQ